MFYNFVEWYYVIKLLPSFTNLSWPNTISIFFFKKQNSDSKYIDTKICLDEIKYQGFVDNDRKIVGVIENRGGS